VLEGVAHRFSGDQLQITDLIRVDPERGEPLAERATHRGELVGPLDGVLEGPGTKRASLHGEHGHIVVVSGAGEHLDGQGTDALGALPGRSGS
jgi:hypothetical protein